MDTDHSTPNHALERIGAYQVLRQIGSGGFAQTFVVLRDDVIGTEFRGCLKKPLAAHLDNVSAMEAFAREARIAANLDHRNVVGLIDFNFDEQPYLVFEFIDGLDLRSLSAIEPLSPRQIQFIASEVALGLHYAHTAGVLHLDVSPSNVLVSRRGHIRLADFGLARIKAESFSASQSEVAGTFRYMAPELISADHAPSESSDLYSLGAVVYELIAGKPAFDGPNLGVLFSRIHNGQRPALATLAPHCTRAFCDLVEQMLQPDPKQRPADALEVFERLCTLGPLMREQRLLASRVLARSPEHTDLPRPPSPVSNRLATTQPNSVAYPEHGAQPTTATGTARQPVTPPDTARSATHTIPSTNPPSVNVRRINPRWVGAIGGFVAVLLGAIAWLLAPTETPPPRSAHPHDSASPTSSDQGGRLGTIHVQVRMWGNVFIDGTSVGPAPYRGTLEAGEHQIGAGIDAPAVTKTVVVNPGGDHDVVLELAGTQ